MGGLDIEWVRAQFPALQRRVDGRPSVFFDGPAGSQVPRSVVDAMAEYLLRSNANTHGAFVTSQETDAAVDGARAAVAALLGAEAPDCVVFGPNMTSLTFQLSRSLAQTWSPGDEVIVTRLDHDANVTPWVLAARDAGATVRAVPFRAADTTLDLEALEAALSPRTRLVAVGAASNATGTVNPVTTITRLAHRVGARVFVDAVHYAPHAAIDVAAWGCDFVACSAYKFFGPHVGLLWGLREPMATLPTYRVRPAGDALPGRWETGTKNHEGIVGVRAAVAYLEALGASVGASGGPRSALLAAYAAIEAYERDLLARLLEGLDAIPGVTIWGIRDRARLTERLPTVSFTHARATPARLAAHLGRSGVFVWHGHNYAVGVSEGLGLEPDGMVRVGILHYNTSEEVDRLLELLDGVGKPP